MKTKKKNKIVIIAEIGECFNGDLNAAVKLIRVARDAGCDYAKFQTLDCAAVSPSDPECVWFKKIALDPEKIRYLFKTGKHLGIPVLFTPENVRTASWLKGTGINEVKISSGSCRDIALIEYAARNFHRVFISTGMASLKEVDTAVGILGKVKDLFLLHCISEYPTGPLLEKRGLLAMSSADVRLNMMRILMQRYPKLKVGYSDHTAGILAPVAAAAIGARVIEKHITLDRRTPLENFRKKKRYLGTDHVLSAEPDELKEMVRQIREVEKMLGDLRWQRTKGELILRDFLRNRF